MKHLIKSITIILILSFAVYACDSDDNGDDSTTGQLELTLTGDVSGTYSFNFVYFENLTDEEFGQHFFMSGSRINADENDPEILINFFKPGSMVTATDYPVVEAEFDEYPPDHFVVTLNINDPSTGNNFSGIPQGGTVSFSSASSNRVEGTLNVQFMGFSLDGSAEPFSFTGQGSFTAGSGNFIP